jgi:hypothetical protein
MLRPAEAFLYWVLIGACLYTGFAAYPPWIIGVLATASALLFGMVRPELFSRGWRENGLYFVMYMAVGSSGIVSALFYIGRLLGSIFR